MPDALVATRRALIRSAAAGAALAAAVGGVARASVPDLADPVQALRASRLMDADMRDGVAVLSIGRGTLYAAPDADRDPLAILGLTVVQSSAAWTLDAGRYGLAAKRLVLFTSLGGDAPVVSFKNPFNGLLCRPFSAIETVHEVVTADDAADIDSRSRWSAVGGRIVRTATRVERRGHPLDPAVWPHQSPGAELRTSHVSTTSADAAALSSPRAQSLTVTASSTVAAPWQPWMLMGDTHGGVVVESQVKTATGLTGLGPDLIAMIERDFAGMLQAPARWGPRRDDAYAQYARHGRPLTLDRSAVRA